MFHRHAPRRLLCLLLMLMLVVSILPVSVFADTEKFEFSDEEYNLIISAEENGYSANPEQFKQQWVEDFNNSTYEDMIAYVDRFLSNFNESKNTVAFRAWAEEFYAMVYGKRSGPIIHHVCVWSPFFNRTHHFLECTSGCDERKNVSRHNRDGEDGNCTCGYVYLSNCGLTTLHFTDMVLSPAFDPEITEYTASPVPYKDVEKTWITAFKFDDLSTIEIPEDRTVTPGKVFKITVTAEDQKTAKTYTVTIAE